jgi:hypothetical protein
MGDTFEDKAAVHSPKSRETRLKAALKANMTRRKAQARARAALGADEDGTIPDPEKGGQQQDG